MEAFNVGSMALFLFLTAPDNRGGQVPGEAGEGRCPTKAICRLGGSIRRLTSPSRGLINLLIDQVSKHMSTLGPRIGDVLAVVHQVGGRPAVPAWLWALSRLTAHSSPQRQDCPQRRILMETQKQDYVGGSWKLDSNSTKFLLGKTSCGS